MSDTKFDINKLLDFTPHAWYKVMGLGLKVVVLVLMILGVLWVKNLMFPPAPANVNNPEIHVQPGGTANYTVIQHADKKRAWWVPTPFVEPFIEVKTDEDKPAVGMRAGGRWEF